MLQKKRNLVGGNYQEIVITKTIRNSFLILYDKIEIFMENSSNILLKTKQNNNIPKLILLVSFPIFFISGDN